MITWKKPALTELANAVHELEAKEPGHLTFSGQCKDPDTGAIQSVPEPGVLVKKIEPSNDLTTIRLVLQDSPITWPVQPTGATRFEWHTATETQDAPPAPLPREQWPSDFALIAATATKQPRTEAQTRKDLIDPVVEKAGYRGSMIKRDETFLFDKEQKGRSFRADYLLFVDKPLAGTHAAVIEAKRETFPPDYGLEQAKLYANVVAKNIRYVFSTNGLQFVQHDRATNETGAPLPMKQFPGVSDLQRKIAQTPESMRRIDKGKFALEDYANRHELDGNSNEDVTSIAQLLIPDVPLRTETFGFFAEMVEKANRLGTAKWETTLGKNGSIIRLTIGRAEVLAVGWNRIRLVLDREQLTGEQFYELGKLGMISTEGVSTALSTAIAAEFRPEMLASLRPLALEASDALLALAAKTTKETGAKRYQSPGVIDYLSAITKRKISHPIYT